MPGMPPFLSKYQQRCKSPFYISLYFSLLFVSVPKFSVLALLGASQTCRFMDHLTLEEVQRLLGVLDSGTS